MPPPLIVRLLLDAQAEFVRAADAVPAAARETAREGLNTPGWIVAHAAFLHDAWLSVDAQGGYEEDCDAWLLDWFRRQRASGRTAVDLPFDEARAALDRILPRATGFVSALTDADLERVPERLEENGWPPGITVGYLVARSIAHLFAHAADLNVIATASGARDLGLPGELRHTFGAPAADGHPRTR